MESGGEELDRENPFVCIVDSSPNKSNVPPILRRRRRR
jgi:hypothetical protein